MNIAEKNEEVKFIISRYDHFYDSINTKGNLYLTINTFILGGVLAGYYSLPGKFTQGTLPLALFVLCLVLNLISMGATLLAIMPFLKSGKKAKGGSVIFFGDVASMEFQQLHGSWQSMTADKWHGDLIKQSHLLAGGLSRKFKRLRTATWFIAAQTSAAIIFGLYLLTK